VAPTIPHPAERHQHACDAGQSLSAAARPADAVWVAGFAVRLVSFPLPRARIETIDFIAETTDQSLFHATSIFGHDRASFPDACERSFSSVRAASSRSSRTFWSKVPVLFFPSRDWLSIGVRMQDAQLLANSQQCHFHRLKSPARCLAISRRLCGV